MKKSLLFTCFVTSIFAATVSNNNDAGAGSLRQAMIDASSGETIDFASNYNISLTSTLPTVAMPLTIDYNGGFPVFLSYVDNNIFNITDSLTITDKVEVRGNITNSGTLTLNMPNRNSAITGSVSGTGNVIKTGSWSFDFQGAANTYTGSTTISAGTLIIANANSLSTTSNVAVASEAGLRLEIDATVSNLSGAGGVVLYEAFSGENYTMTCSQSSDTTFSGSITGDDGAIIKTGTSKLTLSGANTYTGSTTVSAGTLKLSHATAASTSSGVTVSSGATLETGASTTVTNLNGAGNVALGTGTTLTTSMGSNQELSGVVSGAGNLTKSGASQLTLSGDNTFTGATTVSAGTLVLGSANAISTSSGVTVTGTMQNTVSATAPNLSGAGTVTIDSGTTLTANSSSDTTFSGSTGSAGSLIKSGAGTLTVTGTLGHTGTTTVSAGTLNINPTNLPSTATVSSGATVDFGQATGGTYSGVVSGAGNLAKSGSAATVTLSGANDFTGSVTVSQGTLALSNANAISSSSSVAISSGATLSNSVSTTIGGPSGAGLISIGSGTTLTASSSSDTTFSGVISSSGALTKTGTSQLTLSGTNTYTGATTVSAGTLNVTGSIAPSTLTVGSSGTVRGVGTVGPTTVNGTMYPGQSIGTITVAGDYTQAAGSTLTVEVDADGNASKVAATGSATIRNRTTLQVSPLAGDYTEDLTYTILTATNGVSGTFTTLTNLDAAVVGGGGFALNYTANSVQLVFAASPITTLAYLAPSMVNQAIHFQANILSYENDMRIMTRPLCCDKQFYLFAIGDYGFGHIEETASMIPSSYNVGGLDLGFGFQLGCWDLGLIGAYSRSSMKSYDKRGEGTGNNYYGGIIARYYHPIATITMEGIGGCNKLDLKDKTDGVVINEASPNGKSMLLEAKVALNYGDRVKARPIFGARYIWEDVPSYTEENVTKKKEYSSFKQDLVEGMVGILLFGEKNVRGVMITPHIRALWIEEFLTKGENITVTRVATPTSQSTVRVAFGERGYLQLTGGLSAALMDCLQFDITGETNFFQKEAPTADFRGRLSYSF